LKVTTDEQSPFHLRASTTEMLFFKTKKQEGDDCGTIHLVSADFEGYSSFLHGFYVEKRFFLYFNKVINQSHVMIDCELFEAVEVDKTTIDHIAGESYRIVFKKTDYKIGTDFNLDEEFVNINRGVLVDETIARKHKLPRIESKRIPLHSRKTGRRVRKTVCPKL